jgi:hypothetical protein
MTRKKVHNSILTSGASHIPIIDYSKLINNYVDAKTKQKLQLQNISNIQSGYFKIKGDLL